MDYRKAGSEKPQVDPAERGRPDVYLKLLIVTAVIVTLGGLGFGAYIVFVLVGKI